MLVEGFRNRVDTFEAPPRREVGTAYVGLVGQSR